MSARNTWLLLAGAAVAGPLLFRRYRRTPSGSLPNSTPAGAGTGGIAPVIEDTLHRHEGEDMPFVHAFEEALEQETRHEEQLAHDAGLVHA